MKLQHIDLENLKISPLNVRKHGAKSGDDLIPSIKAVGLVQPLLVRPNCEGFEVVAGQRRFNALVQIAQEEETGPVPCVVMDEGDDAMAIEASLAENIARLPMDALDQFEAFQALVKQGRGVEEIADHFGVTERLVTQRLAIANLYEPIRDAFRREEIHLSTLQILTMATTRQQKDWYKLFKSEDGYAPEGYRLKQWLFGGEQIPVENALFDLDTYKGAVVTDLFEEERSFADPAFFWEHQSQAIATLMADYMDDGWPEVILLDVGERFSSWDYVDTSKEDGGRVYVQVSADGKVTPYEGLLSRKEVKKREQAVDGEETPSRPELTQSMQNYLDLHRHAMVRTELLGHQGIALRLCIAQLIAGSALWSVHADPQKANTDAIKDSLANNKAQSAFEDERQRVCALLGMDDGIEDTLVPRKHDWGASHDVHAIFAKLLSLDEASVNKVLTFVVAETLPCGDGLVEVLGDHLSVEVGKHWQPDDTFFDLLRNKEAINAMLKEVGGKSVADGNVTATAKVQKTILQNFVRGEGREKVENWLPRYMRFPMKAYTKHGGIGAIDRYKSVKRHYHAA